MNERTGWANEKPVRTDGRDYVVYWSVLAHRFEDNHALSKAADIANELDLPLLIVASVRLFCGSPTKRQMPLVEKGLQELAQASKEAGHGFIFWQDASEGLSKTVTRKAAAIVTDFGYLEQHRQQRKWLKKNVDCKAIAIENMVVVPVTQASDKAEYAARTIRPKLEGMMYDFLTPAQTPQTDMPWHGDLPIKGGELKQETVNALASDKKATSVSWIGGGYQEASKRLTDFLRNDLSEYEDRRTNANDPAVSFLSPFLRFGHISPAEIVRKARRAKGDAGPFVEELVIRRELAANFCHFGNETDGLSALPDWAGETLSDHASDKREHTYTSAQLENCQTHDAVWNTAMAEMKTVGYLHNHLRMYWGKQILKWMADPEEALKTTLALNNRYFLDGGDPNSHANVMWLFGLHDQGFQERDVIGKVRPFTQKALKRKFDLEAWTQNHGK